VASGGAGWARDSPRGPLSVTTSPLRRLHSPRLSYQVMALQTAAALQRRSKPSCQSMRRREMNAISLLPAALRPFFIFLPASSFKILGASPLCSHPPAADRQCLAASSEPAPCSLVVAPARHHHHRPHLHCHRHRSQLHRRAMRKRTPTMRSSSPTCRLTRSQRRLPRSRG
jgi:hypothetical protein